MERFPSIILADGVRLINSLQQALDKRVPDLRFAEAVIQEAEFKPTTSL